jgi:hypothetical protein
LFVELKLGKLRLKVDFVFDSEFFVFCFYRLGIFGIIIEFYGEVFLEENKDYNAVFLS